MEPEGTSSTAESVLREVTASGVQRALDEFDEIGRAAFLKKYKFGPAREYFLVHEGKRYDSKAILGAARGYDQPDLGPLPSERFSGGQKRVRAKLERLGFKVERHGDSEMSLQEVLRDFMNAYQDLPPVRGDSEPKQLLKQAAEILQDSAPVAQRTHLKVKQSTGKGNWANVPWIALMDERETETTQEGVYAVILFRSDMTGYYLSFNQGVKKAKILSLRERATELIRYWPDSETFGFSREIKLGSGDLPKQYEAANAFAKFYSKDQLPNDSAFLADLENLLAAYDRYLQKDPASQEKKQTPADPPPELPSAKRDLRRIHAEFEAATRESHLSFGRDHGSFVRRFIASIATKRFAILTGLSGSGKTQIALQLGRWFGEERFALVPVRPDWTGAEAVFGYEDALLPLQNGRRAWTVPPILEFMLRAAGDPEWPYLLILDEMNLAHVERYFADLLSGIESGTGVLPNLSFNDGCWSPRDDGPERLPVPENLFVVGTVNVDETTYLFSPKVLDRANTIEFRVEADDLSSNAQRPEPCREGSSELVRGLAELARDESFHRSHPHPEVDELIARLRVLHTLLAVERLEFGHRSFYESVRLAAMLNASGEPSLDEALDLIVLQKLLPRIHGSRRRLESGLRALAAYCCDLQPRSPQSESFDPEGANQSPRLRQSFKKTERMLQNLLANQFTSFTE